MSLTLPLFPLPTSGEVVCEEPLLTIDRQIGVNVVHPDGRVRFLPQSAVLHGCFAHALGPGVQDSKTIFTRMSYDEKSNTSVVHCAPLLSWPSIDYGAEPDDPHAHSQAAPSPVALTKSASVNRLLSRCPSPTHADPAPPRPPNRSTSSSSATRSPTTPSTRTRPRGARAAARAGSSARTGEGRPRTAPRGASAARGCSRSRRRAWRRRGRGRRRRRRTVTALRAHLGRSRGRPPPRRDPTRRTHRLNRTPRSTASRTTRH